MWSTFLSLLLLTNLPTALSGELVGGELVEPSRPLVAPAFSGIDLLKVTPVPAKKEQALKPIIKAKSALLMDLNSGTILFDQNAYEALPMASLTKIMTAVVILERHDLTDVITIKDNYGDIDGARVGFLHGEKFTVSDVLTAMLVRSANDAAMVLAAYDSGNVTAFVDVMNRKAVELHLKNTHFKNPVGFDDPDQYSSAYDLAILTKHALHSPVFRRIVSQDSGEIKALNSESPRRFQSTNMLLGSFLDIEGVKTGTTENAGNCLINLARHPQSRHEVLAILLNSPNRFQENKAMINWAFQNYAW